MSEMRPFVVGDIVTRAGDDRQRVLSVTEDQYCMEVECILAPREGWCEVGDEEYNLCRRYELVSDASTEPLPRWELQPWQKHILEMIGCLEINEKKKPPERIFGGAGVGLLGSLPEELCLAFALSARSGTEPTAIWQLWPDISAAPQALIDLAIAQAVRALRDRRATKRKNAARARCGYKRRQVR